MRQATLDLLHCPACGSEALTLHVEAVCRVEYRGGPADEIESGQIACTGCGATYPIEDYVLSLVSLLPDDVRRDGAYWGQYYRWFHERESYGHLDLRQPSAPFIMYGVGETVPLGGEERDGIHTLLAHHPLIRGTRRALDVGCGVGWTTLYLARQGFEMIGIDPALESVKLAKRYALEQRVPVDYIGGALGHVRFSPGCFDTVFGFHSLHHLPDVRGSLEEVHAMLRTGGCLAFDEHVQSHPEVDRVREQLMRWAMEEVFPHYQDSRTGARSTLPPGLSVNEDVGQAAILPEVERLYHIRHIDFRFVALDGLAEMMYFRNERSTAARQTAADVVAVLNEVLKRSFPEAVEYATVIGQKQATLPRVPQPGLEEVYARYGAFFEADGSAVRPVQNAGPTPWWQLPGKAWRILCHQGLFPLLAEMDSYWRWKRMHGR